MYLAKGIFNTKIKTNVWLAAELLQGLDDALRLAQLQALSLKSGIPLVACGDVHMHVRSRKPLKTY